MTHHHCRTQSDCLGAAAPRLETLGTLHPAQVTARSERLPVLPFRQWRRLPGGTALSRPICTLPHLTLPFPWGHHSPALPPTSPQSRRHICLQAARPHSLSFSRAPIPPGLLSGQCLQCTQSSALHGVCHHLSQSWLSGYACARIPSGKEHSSPAVHEHVHKAPRMTGCVMLSAGSHTRARGAQGSRQGLDSHRRPPTTATEVQRVA